MRWAEYIFLVGSIVAVSLGIYIIFEMLRVFRRQRRGEVGLGPEADVSLFGVKMRGRRTLAVFIIGVALVLFPLRYSVQLISPQEAQAHIVPEPTEYEPVPSLPDPTYEGFLFQKDIRVLDLRSRRVVPEDKKDTKHSPATWTRYTLVRKLSAERKSLEFEFATSGVDIHPRCLTHEFELLKSTEPHYHGDVNLKNTWHIRVDVAGIQPNTDFLIINEATYWNAFQGKKGDWAAIAGKENTEIIGIIILFPEGRPFKDIVLSSGPHRSKELKPFVGQSTQIRSQNNQVFLWKIENPKEGYTYQASWTW